MGFAEITPPSGPKQNLVSIRKPLLKSGLAARASTNGPRWRTVFLFTTRWFRYCLSAGQTTFFEHRNVTPVLTAHPTLVCGAANFRFPPMLPNTPWCYRPKLTWVSSTTNGRSAAQINSALEMCNRVLRQQGDCFSMAQKTVAKRMVRRLKQNYRFSLRMAGLCFKSDNVRT